MGIIYQTPNEDKWLMSCTLGTVSCPPTTDFMTITIPNTGKSPDDQYVRNTALFSQEFLTDIQNRSFYDDHDQYVENLLDLMSTVLPNIKLLDLPYIKSLDSRFKYDMATNYTLFKGATFLNVRVGYKFMESQIQYCSNLSSRDKNVLRLYSYNGDVLLNMYNRNGRIINDQLNNYFIVHQHSFTRYLDILGYNESFVLNEFLQKFSEDMSRIIRNAPKVTKEFLLFRGLKTKDHFHGTVDNVYVNRGFVSTSPNIDVAMGFSEGAYMTIIHVPVGSSMIFNLYSKYIREFEFILPDSTYFLVTKDFQNRQYMGIHKRNIMVNECVLLNESPAS